MSMRVIQLCRGVSCMLLAVTGAACSGEANVDSPSTRDAAGEAQAAIVTVLPTPTNVFAIAGGDSIAVRWVPSSDANIKYYKVYRDGAVVGGAVPTGTGLALYYFDKLVKRDQWYKYQVQAIDQSGNPSSLSAEVGAVLASSGFPIPNITIDDTEASPTSPVRSFLQKGKAFLEVWFPKLVNLMAMPGHYPSTHFVLKAIHEPKPGEPGYVKDRAKCAGSGWYSGGDTLYICDYASGSDMGLFGHEATHIIQWNYVSAPGFLWEGGATWAGDIAYSSHRELPDNARTFMNGYGDGAAFLAWVSEHYGKPNLTGALSRRALQEPFSYDWFKTETGYQVNQLWYAMSGVYLSLPTQLKNQAACARTVRDPSNNPNDPLPILELGPCDPYEHNTFVYELFAKRLHLAALCVSATDRDEVIYAACDDTDAQRWQYGNYGWKNLGTGRCLEPRGGSSVEGTQLMTAACSGAASQQWNYFNF